MEKLRNPKAIASRIEEALRSGMPAFVFDSRLVDDHVVKNLLVMAGVEQYFAKEVHGTLVIYALKDSIALARCQQIVCRNERSERQRACVTRCYYETLKEIIETIRDNIREAASMATS